MSEVLTLRIPPDPRHVGLARTLLDALAEECDRVRLVPREVAELKLVVQEAAINAIRYGRGRGTMEAIELRFLLDEDELTVEIHDDGPGFDPEAIPVPEAEALQEGGYGVHIMRTSMDRFETRREQGRFVVVLTKRYGAGAKTMGAVER